MSATSVVDQYGRAFEFRSWACPICRPAAPGVRVLGWRGGRFHRTGAGVEARIVQCRGCSVLYADPFPVPDDAQQLYGDAEKYFGDLKTEAVVVSRGRELIRDLLARAGGNGELLDVGCGRGMLLESARLDGVPAVGLEFSDAMIAYARSHYEVSIEPLSVEEFAARPGNRERFGIVVLNAVLEHVHDPDSMIHAVATLMRPGGVVYIDVPNEPNLLTRVGNAYNRFIARTPAVYNLSPTWEPFHVYGFNPTALRRLLGKHGLTIEQVHIESAPLLPRGHTLKHRLMAITGEHILRLANVLRMSSNLTAWARRSV